MARNTNSRSTSTREAKPRRTFEEPNWLDIPPTVTERFKSEGMSLRWIRMTMKGNDDIQNIKELKVEEKLNENERKEVAVKKYFEASLPGALGSGVYWL